MASARRTAQALHPTNLHVNKSLFPRDTIQSAPARSRVAGALAGQADQVRRRVGKQGRRAHPAQHEPADGPQLQERAGAQPLPQGSGRGALAAAQPRRPPSRRRGVSAPGFPRQDRSARRGRARGSPPCPSRSSSPTACSMCCIAAMCMYLAQARELGASLVVALNTDASARRLGKGPDRPLNNEQDRAVAGGRARVGQPGDLVRRGHAAGTHRRTKPALLVKGGDYDMSRLAETAVVESYGGKALAIPFVAGYSTTDLVRRIRAASTLIRPWRACCGAARATSRTLRRPPCRSGARRTPR